MKQPQIKMDLLAIGTPLELRCTRIPYVQALCSTCAIHYMAEVADVPFSETFLHLRCMKVDGDPDRSVVCSLPIYICQSLQDIPSRYTISPDTNKSDAVDCSVIDFVRINMRWPGGVRRSRRHLMLNFVA